MKSPAAVGGPPAVWTAFALQGRWKNWVLVGQFLVIAFLLFACITIANKPPDIVVVAEDGAGAFVEASVASAALQSFLREQRGKASDVTLRFFTERFVRLTAGINSTTVDESWAEALALMVGPLATKMRDEAVSQKLMETYRLAQVRTALDFQAIDVVERRAGKTHVRARVSRHKEKLVGGGGSDDALQVDLVLVDVPRSRQHPDGLEVLDWRTGPVDPATAPSPASVPSPTAVTP